MSEPPLISQEDLAAPCSDIGNAQMLYLWYSEMMRWVPSWGRWMTWSPTSGRWIADHGAGAFAHQTAIALYNSSRERADETRRLLDEAETIYRSGTSELRAAQERHDRTLARVRWYLRSQNTERQRAMLTEATRIEAFWADHDAFDTKPYLLSTDRVTVDLTSGETKPPDPADRATRGTSVRYDPDALCPTWDAFLLQVMCGDVELVSYLQRIAGYCLTGSTEEHFLGFFFGDGANGKSTFLTILAEIAGDYYTQAPRGLLFWHRFEGHPTELAALYKRRLVICSEVEQGARLDEAKVKDLTGGDRISARRMREDFWSFLPTHKLLIAGNHWFFVRGQDAGIWRRIHVVPWRLNLRPEEIDTAILPKLRAELPGILAWAVRGALEWRRIGLAEPASCASIRDQHRSDADLFTQFLGDTTILDPEGRLTGDEFYEAYLDWMREQNHAVVLSRRAFAKRVRGVGVKPGNVRRGPSVLSGWVGARLATAEERAARRWGLQEPT